MRVTLAVLLALTAPAAARTVHGLVYDDVDRDGKPGVTEPGVANAVVAFDVSKFVTTDAHGQFTLELHDHATGIVWVRVPDGFEPGPVWATLDARSDQIDLGLRRLPEPHRGPLTFVVAADTHMTAEQPFAADLAWVARDATALPEPPAFFTILGDITQGNKDAQFDLVDRSLADLGVPYVPVPGNHDWYDGGETWFRRYGPDNYSFDIDTTHFVVWNMSMLETDIRTYLGAELAHVDRSMTIVALTHGPPSPAVIRTLRELGVAYVLTGHAHSNRVVDHDGLIELNNEPLLMGGLDFTPGGYRVLTIDHGRIASTHRTVVDDPLVAVMSPARDQCASATTPLIIAAELDAGDAAVEARIDCATPIALRFAGGWTWRAALPALPAGPHTLAITATSSSGARGRTTATFAICEPGPPPAAGLEWPQLGGAPGHTGSRRAELVPPLVTRWTATVGGHLLEAPPVIAHGLVFATATDLGDGGAGGIVAFELATGAVRWRSSTPIAIRGGPAIAGDTVIAAQIDGTIIALELETGAPRWRHELGAGIAPQAAAVFASPAVEAGDVFAGNQRDMTVLADGVPLWTVDPVPDGRDSQSLAAIAIGDGIAVGTFHRALGGVIAWDRITGTELWRMEGDRATAINASPVIAGDTVYVVNGLTEVFALDLFTGAERWETKLDPAGFDWGNATVGAPAIAAGVLVVPTLYRDLIALDAQSGAELWRFAGTPSPLRTTHYRGTRDPGFASSPVITGDIVWAADTAGRLTALALQTGDELWHTAIGTPVLAGLAASGDWLIVASYDGTVHALTHSRDRERAPIAATSCVATATGGCCDAGSDPASPCAIAALGWLGYRRRRRRTTGTSASAIGHHAAGPPELQS